ncbi:hypothetical protein D3C71_929480 [compost metagenome]
MLLDVKIKNFGGTLPQVSEAAVAAFKQHGKGRLADLTRYLKGKENLLDAATIEEHLFKVEDADVFLAHAHRDHDQVVRLAVALQDLGLKVFVDSCVWGDAYTLLSAVDEMYSVDTSKTNTYFYSKVTRTAANVYMILNVALQRMIDRCELFLFLETDASTITLQDYADKAEYVGSPWVFSELAFASTVARRPRSIAVEQLMEVVGNTEDATLEPLVRFQMPPSSHTLEWAELHRVIRTQLNLKAINGKDKLRSLDAIYKPLKLSKAEQRLLVGGLSDAVPVR